MSTKVNLRKSIKIPFNKAHIAGQELSYISEAVRNGDLKGDGPFTAKASKWLEERFDIGKVMLTHSCTGALEIAALLLDIKEGDEVILPSYTFVSTANAFALRGAKPVFIDIRSDTLNMDEALLEEAINERTKAICPVHYAGVGCEMDKISEIAKRKKLVVVEDAAQGIMSKYKDSYLGSIAELATFSFHETKNFSCGEGGALLINDPDFIERAEIIREKGTNRSKFFRGEVDKYTWVDLGSSYLPSEVVAAFLYGQFEKAEEISKERLKIYNTYQSELQDLADSGKFKLPFIPSQCEHNAHMFYLLFEDESERDKMLEYLRAKSIGAVFHYIPLHTSPMGESYGYKQGDLPVTEKVSSTILRLPLFCGLTVEEQAEVIAGVKEFYL